MAEAVKAGYRSIERVEKDEFIDVTLTTKQAAAILALLRHAGGEGQVALELRPVFVGLATMEEHLPDLAYAATHTTAQDGRPLIHFADAPPADVFSGSVQTVPARFDPPAGVGG